ncbi:pollen-specific leucine-rich repeat extensin-like protein 4 [Benincasa hispida]|uniref:pollen-specific leucine-rich repeat extensin-like protein 4 n=1 Tax=Benincasa hispida TaxID=102211 RepID=UPI0018FF3160|nr:pollen-specific leucine-rich repeat extensin-like protein 4 [Benincasa hispida]
MLHFGNDSSVSSYSSASVSISPPSSTRKTTTTLAQTKPTHGGANSSPQLAISKPSSAHTKLPTRASKTTVTPPAKIPQSKPKTPQQKPKSAPNQRAKTQEKPRTRPSSTVASKPYTKSVPQPIIPNITMVGATHDPLPAYAHNAPSPAVRPPPPLSIEPLATIYPVESDALSQPSPSPILISSPETPHTPMGTPSFTPPIPPSDSPASEHNLEELAELARLDEQVVFRAILASLNQGQEEE